LIGPQKERYPESKTKDNAVHAGLFQQSPLANHGHYLKAKQPIFLNNNWLIVQALTETTAATEVQEKAP
jgi:hypothetical protein